MKKGMQTRNMILDCAMELFSQRGYRGVTMFDINNATGLSAGGLYRYFKSTKEIYIELLTRDEKLSEGEVDPRQGMTGEQILKYVFDQNYAVISKQQLGWVVALYEFMICESDYMKTMKKRQHTNIATSKSMIAVDRPDLDEDNLSQLALFILNYLNGLHITGTVYAFTEDDIDKQFKLLRHLIFRTTIDVNE